MSYNVLTSDLFIKEFKALCKRHRSLQKDIFSLVEKLKINPIQGEPLGKDCYKIRVAITSKAKGKSGGARLITRVRIVQNTVYLLSIYDKSDKENISDKDLQSVLKSL